MPSAPRITQVVSTYILVTLSALAWLTALTLTDIDVDRNLPNTIITGAYVFASTCTIAACVLGANYVAQRRILRSVEMKLDRIKEDTGSIPTVTDQLADMPTLAEVVTSVALMEGEMQVQGERLRWLLVDRGLLPPEPAEDDENVRHLTREAYRLGRRSRS